MRMFLEKNLFKNEKFQTTFYVQQNKYRVASRQRSPETKIFFTVRKIITQLNMLVQTGRLGLKGEDSICCRQLTGCSRGKKLLDFEHSSTHNIYNVTRNIKVYFSCLRCTQHSTWLNIRNAIDKHSRAYRVEKCRQSYPIYYLYVKSTS